MVEYMAKAYILTLAAALACVAPAEQSATPVLPEDEDHAALYENKQERDARMAWWRDAKFGMFIHYGLYSGLAGEFQGRPGGGEWIQTNLNLDTDTYAAEAIPLFNPQPGCTEEWAKLAEEAGCRYMVLTTKHHDGFALFATSTSDYNVQHTNGFDLVKEYVESARKHGMRVGFYHSVIDWHHPSYDNTISRGLCYPAGQAKMLKERQIPRDHAAYQQYLHSQVRELLTNYGKVDIMWWDYSQGKLSGATGWQAPKLIRMTRELQPGIIMNNRLYAYSSLKSTSDAAGLDLRCGDFMTPEKRLIDPEQNQVDWESCMTLGNHWGYNKNDVRYKPVTLLLRNLEQCAARGGNLLLNISPKSDGSIPPAAVDAFRRIGQWMKVNGEAIYGSKPVIPALTLPGEWFASISGENTYLLPPVLTPQEDVVVRIPAHQIDTVHPTVLGQPDCKIAVSRVEEPGEDEPKAFIQLTIPASAWQNAIEGLPVIKLANAH